jgi:hypothetical protein
VIFQAITSQIKVSLFQGPTKDWLVTLHHFPVGEDKVINGRTYSGTLEEMAEEYYRQCQKHRKAYGLPIDIEDLLIDDDIQDVFRGWKSTTTLPKSLQTGPID